MGTEYLGQKTSELSSLLFRLSQLDNAGKCDVRVSTNSGDVAGAAQEEVDRFLNENLDRIRGEVRRKLLAEIASAQKKSIIEVRMILKEEARAAIERRLIENPGIVDTIKERLNEDIVDGFSFGKGKMTFEKADPELVARMTQDTSGAGSVVVPNEFGDPELLARAFELVDLTNTAGQMMMLAESLWLLVVKVDVAAQSDEWRSDFEKARQRYFELFGPIKGSRA